MIGNISAVNYQQQSVRLNWLAAIGFFVLCTLTMLNLNFLTRTFLDTDQVLSIFYLLACLLVLFGLKFPIKKSVGSVGIFLFASIAAYLAISTRLGLGVESRFFTSISSGFYRVLTAQLITIAAAVGARHLLLAGKLQMTLRIAFGLTLAAALTIILSKIFPVLAPQNSQGRVGGVFFDANAAGHAVCYSAAFGFACIVNEKSLILRMFLFAALALLIPCLLLTNSRSAILFMGLLVFSQIFISPLMRQKGTVIAILVLSLGIPLGILFVVNQQGSRVDAYEAAELESRQERLGSLVRIFTGEADESDTGHRFTVAAVGLRYFASSPVIGVGFYKLTKMPEIQLGCHNTFLRVLGEGGIFCGLFYMLAIAVVGFAGWKCKRAEVRCLVVGFIICFACSAMVSHTALTARSGNVIMGICLGFLTGVSTLEGAAQKRRRAELRHRQELLKAQRRPAAVVS